MKQFLAFLKSKTFFTNAALGIIFLVFVFLGLQWWLKNYTHHGEKIEVPDLSGLSLRATENLLTEKNLTFLVIDSSAYNPNVPLGVVVDQYPLAGSFVKSEREILLSINPFTVKKIEVPNVIDKTLRRAIYDLESKGFKVGNLIYKPDLAKDVVLGLQKNGQQINPGEKYVLGTALDLLVGTGLGDERTSVPMLLGLNAQQAEDELVAHSLNIGVKLFDDDVTDSLSAKIYKQAPIATHEPKLRLGTTVDVWLTNDSTKIQIDSLFFQNLHQTDTLPQNIDDNPEF